MARGAPMSMSAGSVRCGSVRCQPILRFSAGAGAHGPGWVGGRARPFRARRDRGRGSGRSTARALHRWGHGDGSGGAFTPVGVSAAGKRGHSALRDAVADQGTPPAHGPPRFPGPRVPHAAPDAGDPLAHPRRGDGLGAPVAAPMGSASPPPISAGSTGSAGASARMPP